MRIQFSIAAIFAVCSCSIVSKDQQRVIGQISQISKYPVNRSALIKALDLGAIQSERVGGGVRGGHAWFTEIWLHPTGIKVTGWDSEYVGADAITRKAIDEILNNPNRTQSHTGARGFVEPFSEPPPRRVFKRVTVSDVRDKVVFDSMAPENKKTNNPWRANRP